MGYITSIIIFYSLCIPRLYATDLRSELARIYTEQIGVVELSNKNDGAEVALYLSTVGLDEGNPYCAAFVKWCFLQTGIDLPYLTGYSRTCCNEDNIIWERTGFNTVTPDKGTLFWWPRNGGGHTGFIDRWGSEHTFTVEGNVTTENGFGGVQAKIRPTKSFLLVSDPIAPYIQQDTSEITIIREIEKLLTPEPISLSQQDEPPTIETQDRISFVKLGVLVILLGLTLFKDNESKE